MAREEQLQRLREELRNQKKEQLRQELRSRTGVGQQPTVPSASLSVKPTFREEVSGALSSRRKKVGEAERRQQQGKQGFLETGFQQGGQVAGFIGDVAFSGLKALTPDFIEKPIAGLVEKAAPIIQPIAEKYGKFAESNPRAAANIEAITNIASIIPETQAAKLFTSGTKAVAKTGVGAAKEFGEQAIKKALPKLQESAVQKTADALEQAAGQTTKPRKLLQKAAARGKRPAEIIVRNGAIPDVVDGKIVIGNKADMLDVTAQPFNQALEEALDIIQPSIPRTKLIDVENAAVKLARSQKNIDSNIANDLERSIRAEFADYRQNFGEDITLKQLNGIKKAKWADTKFDATKPLKSDINYLIGNSAKETIERSLPKSAFDIKQLNSHIGDILEGSKLLRSLDGRAVKGGRLGKYFGQVVGTGVGSAMGGGFGGVAGLLMSNYIVDILQKSTFSNPIRTAILNSLRKTYPEAFKNALQFIETEKRARINRLLLPEKASPSSSIPLPSAGILEGQQKIKP